MFEKNKDQSRRSQDFFLGDLEEMWEWNPKETEIKKEDGKSHDTPPSPLPLSFSDKNVGSTEPKPKTEPAQKSAVPPLTPKPKGHRPLHARRELPKSGAPEKEKETLSQKVEKPVPIPESAGANKSGPSPRHAVKPVEKAPEKKASVRQRPSLFAIFRQAVTGARGALEKKLRPKKQDPTRALEIPEKRTVPIQDHPSLHPKEEEAVRSSLDGMYGVYRDRAKKTPRKLTFGDWLRYAVLFVCIFGFLVAGYFVLDKLYGYYRSYLIYSGLQDMVSVKDRFSDDYLKKSAASVPSLTPQDIFNGKTLNSPQGSMPFSEEQQTLVSKIAQLKKINGDTAGWITIEGTVVNYPIVWSPARNYYLHRDFYGKNLSGGSIYMDERNSPNITENRNTVIYGHNMADGSMFSSIHDFKNATVFYGATIQIATQDGIFIYKPFSVHESNAYDNYFETNFVSDSDFVDFCEVMAFISYFQTDYTFDANSQIITLSTCMDNTTATDGRFAVHAILVQVIR